MSFANENAHCVKILIFESIDALSICKGLTIKTVPNLDDVKAGHARGPFDTSK